MRKTKTVTIRSTPGRDNRDAGKTFLLTEMSAVRIEKWSQRALLALANSGLDIPPEVLRMGAGAVVAAGMRALLGVSFAEAEPLLDEMLDSVQIVPDAKRPEVLRPFDAEDIEEVSTLLTLRSEVIELHVGFSIAGYLSTLGQSATVPNPSTSNTQTSPQPSA